MAKTLSIIIPVFNEEKTIETVLQKIWAQDFGDWAKEIIVVDDGSTDNSKIKVENCLPTEAAAQAGKLKIENLRLLLHDRNMGKGMAIQTGLKAANGDAIIIQDADLEYDIAEIKTLLDEFEKYGDQTTIYGSRNLAPKNHGYTHFVWGVKFLTALINLLFGSKLTDAYTCYKLFPAWLIKSLGIKSAGFEFEMEITVKILKQGYQIKETPINYYPRKFNEGKKIRAMDGLKGIWTLLKFRF